MIRFLKLWKIIECVFVLVLFSCNAKNKEKDTANTSYTAEHHLRSLIALAPDSLLPKENLIQFYRDNNEDAKALSITQQFLVNDSNNERLLHIAGVLFLESGDTINAINSFKRAISIQVNINDLLYLGHIYALQKNSSAIAVADSLSKKPAFQKESYYIKGVYFSSIGDFEKAILFFNRCTDIDFTFMEAYREKARTLILMEKLQEAIYVLTKATTIQNNFVEGYFYLGQCYEKTKNTKQAIESYQKALMYDPNYSEADSALQKLKL